jgi:hypothetical protein
LAAGLVAGAGVLHGSGGMMTGGFF